MNLIKYTSHYKQAVTNYVLEDNFYSKRPVDAIRDAAQAKNFLPVLSFNNDSLVNFFVLDSGPTKADYSNQEDTILLRSFSTDSRQTGKGFAATTLTLLPAFVKANFPEVHSVTLGVNQANTPAINLYKKCDFRDTGRRYLGTKGWQLIFELTLK